MKTFRSFICLALLVVSVSFANAQSTNPDPEAKIKELGIKAREPGPSTSLIEGAVRVDNMVYLSGHGPMKEDGEYMIGKVGGDFNLEQAQEAARLTGMELLRTLKAEVGDLNNVKRIVKVLGMVNAVPTFDQHSQVINGFSELMIEVFGENGRHARSAIGLGSLPRNIAVEIEMIVELKH